MACALYIGTCTVSLVGSRGPRGVRSHDGADAQNSLKYSAPPPIPPSPPSPLSPLSPTPPQPRKLKHSAAPEKALKTDLRPGIIGMHKSYAEMQP